jgi:hypothetical protein
LDSTVHLGFIEMNFTTDKRSAITGPGARLKWRNKRAAMDFVA